MAAGTFLAVAAALLALPEQIALARCALVGDVAAARKDFDEQIAAARVDVLAGWERRPDVCGAICSQKQTRSAPRRPAVGRYLARADAALATVEGRRQDIKPVIENAAATEQSAASLRDAYRALPAQMGERFGPSWAKLELEIICGFASFQRSRTALAASRRMLTRLLQRP